MPSHAASVSRRKTRFAALAAMFPALLFAVQCSAQEPPRAQTPRPPAGTCKEPRPQMCSMIYAPVCGEAKDGSHKTYGNACSACNVVTVVGYTEGACKKDGS